MMQIRDNNREELMVTCTVKVPEPLATQVTVLIIGLIIYPFIARHVRKCCLELQNEILYLHTRKLVVVIKVTRKKNVSNDLLPSMSYFYLHRG